MWEFLHDGPIAVVGNAQSLLQSDHGEQIEACHQVLRMNKGAITRATGQGTRCDIHAFSTARSLPARDPFPDARHRIWMSPKFREDVTGPQAPLFYPLAQWERLSATLGTRPSVGAMVLDLLAAQNVSDVAVFGFDFKATPTHYNNSLRHGPHDYAAERAFAERLIAAQGWRFYA